MYWTIEAAVRCRLYLDQNKWIELARAARHPAEHSDIQPLLDAIIEAASEHRLVLPLTSTIIFETHKIKDPQRREYLARLQSVLSGGLVFRGRHLRLQTEISDVVRGTLGLGPAARAVLVSVAHLFRVICRIRRSHTFEAGRLNASTIT